MNLQQAIKETGDEVQGAEQFAQVYEGSYSGRGMYGKECPAITGTWTQCQRFIAETIKRLANDVIADGEVSDGFSTEEEEVKYDASKNELNELIDSIMDFSTDQFGRGEIILYWPREEYEAGEES